MNLIVLLGQYLYNPVVLPNVYLLVTGDIDHSNISYVTPCTTKNLAERHVHIDRTSQRSCFLAINTRLVHLIFIKIYRQRRLTGSGRLVFIKTVCDWGEIERGTETGRDREARIRNKRRWKFLRKSQENKI